MKDLQEIIKQEPVFVGNFENEDQVFGSFEVADKERSEYKILFASYDTPAYEGYAWGLCIKKGTNELLEFSGSHCSCYGLEGQFSPEPAVLQELANKAVNGGWTEDPYKTELKTFIGA